MILSKDNIYYPTKKKIKETKLLDSEWRNYKIRINIIKNKKKTVTTL